METPIRICGRCGQTYDWRRSPSSSLKMTYCGSLCEKADLGFTIETLLYDFTRQIEHGSGALKVPIYGGKRVGHEN